MVELLAEVCIKIALEIAIEKTVKRSAFSSMLFRIPGIRKLVMK